MNLEVLVAEWNNGNLTNIELITALINSLESQDPKHVANFIPNEILPLMEKALKNYFSSEVTFIGSVPDPKFHQPLIEQSKIKQLLEEISGS